MIDFSAESERDMHSTSTPETSGPPIPLRLRLMAEPQNAATVRTFIGASLRTIEQPQSVIDDLRLAISELFAVLVANQCGSIDVTLTISGQVVTAALTGPSVLPTLPPETLELTRRLTDGGLRLEDSRWVVQTPRH
jgi:hypothetical protein